MNTTAFLPLNSDGKEVCCLLRKAFDAGVLFAIGKSPTTGEENNIIWNGVELKTSKSGGPARYSIMQKIIEASFGDIKCLRNFRNLTKFQFRLFLRPCSLLSSVALTEDQLIN